MKRLAIIGSVGNCIDIVEAVQAINESARKPRYDLIGFLDDAPERIGQSYAGLKVLGPIALAKTMNDTQFICGIGSPRSFVNKAEIVGRVDSNSDRFESVVHPTAVISPSAIIGHGSVILGNTTICANARIGQHAMLLPNCVVGHDSVIGDYTIMAAGVLISGNVVIETGCYLGAGSCVRESINIGAGSLVGMGSVVIRDVKPASVVAGSPARPIALR